MALRLLRWWHRGRGSSGRHLRVLPVVTVPSAAATLVSTAWADPLVTGALGVEAPAAPEPAPLEPAQRELSGSAVGLVFADGAQVELAADDPRVGTFRAAAAALLDPHTR